MKVFANIRSAVLFLSFLWGVLPGLHPWSPTWFSVQRMVPTLQNSPDQPQALKMWVVGCVGFLSQSEPTLADFSLRVSPFYLKAS